MRPVTSPNGIFVSTTSAEGSADCAAGPIMMAQPSSTKPTDRCARLAFACAIPSASARWLFTRRLALQGPVEIIEKSTATLEPFLVVIRGECDAIEHLAHALCFAPPEPLVLEVEVVHDLGEGPQCGVAQADFGEQHLEGALLAPMRVFGVGHVEAQLIALRLVTRRSDELEARRRVDELPDEPRARDAIDVHTASGDPAFAAQFLESSQRRCGAFGSTLFSLHETAFQLGERGLGSRAAIGAEEIELGDLPESATKAGQGGTGRGRGKRTGPTLRAARGSERCDLFRQGVIVGVASRAEGSAELCVADSFQEPRFAHQSLAACGIDFLRGP